MLIIKLWLRQGPWLNSIRRYLHVHVGCLWYYKQQNEKNKTGATFAYYLSYTVLESQPT